jgi:ribonuclease E
MKIVMPSNVNRIQRYSGSEPLFNKYGIENEIARIHDRHVPLQGGGSLVIDQTEALVAIDVNSGSFRADNDAEKSAYLMNLRAAEAIARQIRLRDLGGVIVNDFIDMREERHRRGVERALREAVERDRARTRVLRISPFGLIEMTRQRIRPSLRRSVYENCPSCNGVGQVKTAESLSIEVMRLVMSAAGHDQVTRMLIEVHDRVGNYLNNRKRKDLIRIEDENEVEVVIVTKSDVSFEHMTFRAEDAAGREVNLS